VQTLFARRLNKSRSALPVFDKLTCPEPQRVADTIATRQPKFAKSMDSPAIVYGSIDAWASLTALITAGIAPSVPASPTLLTPSGLLGLGLSFFAELEMAEIVGARHTVILERAVQQLAAIGIVGDVLHQHLADPLDDAAKNPA
jgi:hypothetical protein